MVTESGRGPTDNVFVLPLFGEVLLYAPLHHLAALVDGPAARQIRDHLIAAGGSTPESLRDILQVLAMQPDPAPLPRHGALRPAFLGLIPTRSCNLACAYCGFAAAGEQGGHMDLQLAREAIQWYLDQVAQLGLHTVEIHFFGGEPFCAEEVIDLSVYFAQLKAAEAGCTVRFEVATNGAFDEGRCRWAADSLDSIVLSLDGPAAVQDRHRQRRDGKGSYQLVARNARLLSQGTAELSVRACVTDDTVGRMAEIAAWLCEEFRPGSVSFEPLQPSPASQAAGLLPPDPWAFARSWIQAASIMEAHGVRGIYASADIAARRVSFCPVGQDVPIVWPDGRIAACYLLEEDWQARGLDLWLGKFENGAAVLDGGTVAAVRSMNVWNKPLCTKCFCKWHCAGGCHVNHVLSVTAGSYDRLCIQTRLITLCTIVKAMGREDRVHELWQRPGVLESAVWQASDAIADLEAQP